MTTQKIGSYSIALCIALLSSGGTSVYASEVVGTLSSSAGAQSPVTGVIDGTVGGGSTLSGGVSGGSTGGGGGGGGSNGSSNSRSSANGNGEVLGAATSNPQLAQAPGFPNAGEEPETTISNVLWGSSIAASTLGLLASMVLIEAWLRKRIVR